ncbi:hypothetical protein BH24CHL1_BH24CHL1_03960 [soil metagenome]
MAMSAERTPAFGDLLRQSRLAAKLTQERLAELAGISARAVTDLERGVIRAPRRDTLDMLAEALDLPPDEREEWHRLRRQYSTRRPPNQPRGSTEARLPQPPDSLIGRDEDVKGLVAILESDTRLVTVTGVGGVGKTRVALEVGHRVGDAFKNGVRLGVRLIELSTVRDPNLLVPAIAQELGLREGDADALGERLRTYLSRRNMLLILDNFEHLLDAAVDVSELLASSPTLNVLVTSRARLQIHAEHEYPLSPLRIPSREGVPSHEHADAYSAIQLFVERSRQVNPDFSLTSDNVKAITTICTQLDGLPLAIELAVTRIKVLTPQQMLPRLLHRFEFLTEGLQDAPDRHRTMRAAIGGSYDLLHSEEQELLRRLSVFVGGWTFEAAEAVAPPGVDVLDGLSTLANNSLIHHSTQANGLSRFRILETVREFGLELLHHLGEYDDLRDQHASYFLQLAEEAEPELKGPRQVEWLAILGNELANFQAALEWSVRPDVDPEIALRLAGALSWFWESRGHVSEGRHWLNRALSKGSAKQKIQLKALAGAGWLAHIQHDSSTARAILHECLDIARETGDRWTTAWAFHLLGRVAYFDGDAETARAFGEQSLSLARDVDDQWIVAWALHLLALAAHIEGDFNTARRCYEESLEIRQEIGYPEGIGTVTGLLGMLALREGDHDRALRLLRTSLMTNRDLGARWLTINMVANIVTIAAIYGDPIRAARLAGFVAAMSDSVGASPIPIAESTFQEGLSAARRALGDGAYEHSWSDGQSLSMDEAIDEALSVKTSGPLSPQT